MLMAQDIVMVDRVICMWMHCMHAHNYVQALEGVTTDASGDVDVHIYDAKA